METKKEIPNPLKSAAAESYRLGLEAYKVGHLNVAFTHFTAAVDLNSNLADAFYHIGLIYTEMDNFELCERFYNMALAADPNHFGAKRKLGLEKDASADAPVKITDTDFFYHLKNEGTPEAAQILEALEKMDFKLELKARSYRLEYALRFLAGTLKLLFPAAFAGFIIGMGVSGMGFGSFTWAALISGSIVFLVRVIEKIR